MEKIIKTITVFIISVVTTTLVLQLIHILASIFGITTFSNILDGMPFYQKQNYLEFIFLHFLDFILAVAVLSLVMCLNYYLFKRLFEYNKKRKLKEAKLYWFLYVYLLLSIVYFEFFAIVSPSGPKVSVPGYDIVFRVLILIAPLFYFLCIKGESRDAGDKIVGQLGMNNHDNQKPN